MENTEPTVEIIPWDGEPCDHPGCLSHLSHPCEGCGRIGGRDFETHDADGYPTDEALDAIRKWPIEDGWRHALMGFVKALLHPTYSRVRTSKVKAFATERPVFEISISTGGWSGNESILAALADNVIFHGMYWESSHRGGLVVYQIPIEEESQ